MQCTISGAETEQMKSYLTLGVKCFAFVFRIHLYHIKNEI